MQNASGIRRDGAADNGEQRGLAGAVRPDNPERLALTKIKVEAFGDDDRAETFGNLFKREQRVGHIIRPPARPSPSRSPTRLHKASPASRSRAPRAGAARRECR